jgi:hypothetical protein
MVGKLKEKIQVSRTRHGREHGETDVKGADWIHLAENTDRWRALVGTVTNLRVPQK